MLLKQITRALLLASLSLPVIVHAEANSVQSQKSFSQGVKENPLMGFITSKHDGLWMQELHSQPEDGSLRISYNNDLKTQTTSVSAQRLPDMADSSVIIPELTKGIAQALEKSHGGPVNERSFETVGGNEVNCAGIIMEDKQISNELCVVVFSNYYIQANMLWPLEDGKEDDKAFSRSDEFVTVVMDRFGEYPDI